MDKVGRRSSVLRQVLLAWYRCNRRDLPWRGVRDPYAILVSEVMLQQTQAERVAPKFTAFLARFPDFRTLARAPTADVIRAWAPLGYNQRAVRLQRVAERVVDEFGGRLPSDLAVLRGLEGVGDYTAAAVACLAFGKHVAVVDTNVRRVLGRVFWGPERPEPKQTAILAQRLVPRGQAADWNQALMDLGATVCLARAPRCSVCPVRAHCRAAPAFRNGLPLMAETKARYRAAPFKESSRYYRGRIVAALRSLADGEGILLADLGKTVKPGYTEADLPWLWGLVTGLERDGLVRVYPDESGPSPGTRVSLP